MSFEFGEHKNPRGALAGGQAARCAMKELAVPSPIKRYRVRLQGTEPADVASSIAHRVQREGVRIRLNTPPPIDTPTEIYIHYGDGRVALAGRGWVSAISGVDASFEVEWTQQSDPELIRFLFDSNERLLPIETVSLNRARRNKSTDEPITESIETEQFKHFIPSMTLVAEALESLILENSEADKHKRLGRRLRSESLKDVCLSKKRLKPPLSLR